LNAVSGVIKTRALLDVYITDQKLTDHILFFDTVFPKYEMFIDQVAAEDNSVIIRARLKGCHEGEFNGIAPTYRSVEFPVVVGYEIENEKIINHWVIADQVMLMEQLGVMNVLA
jgi:predicted ester cyclase